MSRLLGDRDFLRLWLGQTVSEVGSRVSREGIPLTAALVLGATPSELGALSALGGLTALLASPVAGLLVDRTRRRPLLVASDLGRALVLLAVPLAAWGGWLSIGLLFAVVTVHGLFTVLFDVAYPTFVPTLVEDADLLEANAKLTAGAATAEIVGPGLTGALVQALTAPVAILVDSASFLFSAAAVLAIERPEVAPSAPPRAEGLAELLAGLRVVAREPVLRALGLRAASVSFSYGFLAALYVLYAVRALGLSPVELGFVVAAGGVSSLAGSFAAERLGRTVAVGPLLFGAALWSGVVLFLLPLASRGAPLACLIAAQLLGDVAFSVYAIHETTLRQRLAAGEVLGRVNAAMQLASKGVWPIGALVGGALAEVLPMSTVLALAAAGVTASASWLAPLRRVS